MKEREGGIEWSFEGEGYTLHWDHTHKALSLHYGGYIHIESLHPLAVFRVPCEAAKRPLEKAPNVPFNLPEFSVPRCREWHRLLKQGSLAFLQETDVVHHDSNSLEVLPSDHSNDPCMSFKVFCHPRGLEISTILKNPSTQPILLDKVIPLIGKLTLGGAPARWRFFKMSSNTSTPSGSLSLTDTERSFGFGYIPHALFPGCIQRMLYLPGESLRWKRGAFSSQWFTLLTKDNTRVSLCTGFLGSSRHFSSIHYDSSCGLLQAVSWTGGVRIPPIGSFPAHTLVLIFDDDPHRCLDTYLDRYASETSPRKRSISLWGSWYAGFYDRFSSRDLEENLVQVTKRRDLIEYFQIDDGYQKALGDWLETNQRLPEGLEAFARGVTQKNLKPGIWVAPFVVSKDASVFVDHKDWLVKGPRGNPLMAGVMPGWFSLRPYYTLDTTLPEVQEWLHILFSTLVKWGFKLFKLDYLAAGTVPGIRANLEMTPAQAYGLGLRIIRDAVGDLPLMGALAPLLAGAGLFDMQRVSADTSFGGNHWLTSYQRILRDPITPCVRNNIRNNLARAYLNGRIWTNDCDALVHEGLTVGEQRTHLSTNLLLGGVCQIGHDLRKSGYPWEDIHRLQHYTALACRVPDLFETHMPEEAIILASEKGINRNRIYYLLINRSDRTCLKRIRNPCDYFKGIQVAWRSVRDFWERSAAAINEGDTISVPPHDCKLFEFEAKIP